MIHLNVMQSVVTSSQSFSWMKRVYTIYTNSIIVFQMEILHFVGFINIQCLVCDANLFKHSNTTCLTYNQWIKLSFILPYMLFHIIFSALNKKVMYTKRALDLLCGRDEKKKTIDNTTNELANDCANRTRKPQLYLV